MTEAQELLAAVRARTAGTPYVVSETDDGFDVRLDLENPSWHAVLQEQHLSRTWIYHVRLDEGARTLSITDDVRDVRWGAAGGSRGGAPVPVLGASASRTRGRVGSRSFQRTWVLGEHGFEKVAEHHHSSAEGRDLVRGPARELGWTERRGTAELIGLYVGVGTLVLLLVAGIAVGVVALAGGL
jgi:hypothetical protein